MQSGNRLSLVLAYKHSNKSNQIVMEEFILIFRESRLGSEVNSVKPTQEEILAIEKVWADWIGSIAAEGKYAGGFRPGTKGRTVKPENVITDGPYAEVKEIIVGAITVKASSMEEAVELAKGCPSILNGGNVEVRDLIPA